MQSTVRRVQRRRDRRHSRVVTERHRENESRKRKGAKKQLTLRTLIVVCHSLARAKSIQVLTEEYRHTRKEEEYNKNKTKSSGSKTSQEKLEYSPNRKMV